MLGKEKVEKINEIIMHNVGLNQEPPSTLKYQKVELTNLRKDQENLY